MDRYSAADKAKENPEDAEKLNEEKDKVFTKGLEQTENT